MTPSVQRRARHAFVLALSAFLCHQGVQAAAQESSSISDFRYALTDLAPSDGIRPSIVWGEEKFTQTLSVSLSNGPDALGDPDITETHEEKGASPEAMSMNHLGFDTTGNWASQSVSAQVDSGALWQLMAMRSRSFSLAPHTAVTFKALAQHDVSVTVPSWSVVWEEGWGRYNSGYIGWLPIEAGGTALIYAGDIPASSRVSEMQSCRQGCLGKDAFVLSLSSYFTAEKSEQKQLQLTLTNDTDRWLSSNFVTAVQILGSATAPINVVPIPEPSAAMQVLFGLGTLGVMLGIARRQRL